ncbi:type II secretion system F family protein [Candidatus Desantisbacteria bacterium]|nr:type II secretion system F family protein [Candidatus Desantisbacteria bacterium]
MLKLNMPVTEGLDVLTQDLPRFFMKKIKRIISDIEDGNSISEALKKHPGLFPESYLSMVKIGEQSDTLPRVLALLVEYLETRRQTRQQIGMALAYPAYLIFIAMGIFVFLQTFVIPAFEDVYLAFGSCLPLPTRIAFKSLSAFNDYILPFLFIFVVILFALILTQRLIRPIERMRLLLPFFGHLWRKKAELQLCQLFSALLESGADTVYSLELVREGIWSNYLKYKLEKVLKYIREGKTIGEAFARAKGFSKTLVWMIQLGEQSENLSQTLSVTAQTYQEDIDILATRLTTSIEPMIHIVFALIIAAMVIVSYLPIFGIAELVLDYM